MSSKVSKMIVPTEIEAAADVDRGVEEGRYALACLQVVHDGPAAWVVATNGRILAAANCYECTVPDRTLVPAKPLEKLRRLAVAEGAKRRDLWVEVSGERVTVRNDAGLVAESQVGVGRFPTSIPAAFPAGDEETHVMVCLSVDLLHQLARALTERGQDDDRTLTLFISREKDEAIGVLGAEGIGVIMPKVAGPELGYREKYQRLREQFCRAYRREEEAGVKAGEQDG